jgi:hypothetical protein
MRVWGGVGARTSNDLDHNGPPNETVRSHVGVAAPAPRRCCRPFLLDRLGWLVSSNADAGNDDGADSMLVDRLRRGRIGRSTSIRLASPEPLRG